MQSPEKFKEALAIKEKWNREHDRNYKSVLGYAAPWVARKDLIFVGIRIHLEGDDTVHHAVFEFPEEPGNLQFTSGFEMITAAGERIIKAFDVSGYPDSALLPKGFRVVPDASGGCHTGKELIENSLYEKFFPSEYGRKYSE